MPKQIQVGSVTQVLQRAFGFKGRYTPLLDEIIVPVYVIADPSPAAITRLCAGNLRATADAGTDLNYIQIFNPATSGIVVNVTHVVVFSTIKQTFFISFFDDDPSSIVPAGQSGAAFRDRRNVGDPIGQLRLNTATAALVGEQVAAVQVDGALSQTAAWEADTSDPRQPLAVLGPGQGLIVQEELSQVSPQQFGVNFRWLEIPSSVTNPFGGLPG